MTYYIFVYAYIYKARNKYYITYIIIILTDINLFICGWSILINNKLSKIIYSMKRLINGWNNEYRSSIVIENSSVIFR